MSDSNATRGGKRNEDRPQRRGVLGRLLPRRDPEETEARKAVERSNQELIERAAKSQQYNPYRGDPFEGPSHVDLPPGYKITNKKEKDKAYMKDVAEARLQAKSYADAAATLVGYDRIREDFADAVNYHLMKDENLIKISGPDKPPQVFIIQGSSGTGKTALANALMHDAWKKGDESNTPVFLKAPNISDFTDSAIGASEKKTAEVFDSAFSRPTILFIDEAQTFATSGSANSLVQSQSETQMKIRNTILLKINEMKREKKQCILVLATDDFGALPEQLTRRGGSGTYDLDIELKKSDLIEITRRELDKYSVKHLEPTKVFAALEENVRSKGHNNLTPDDVVTAVYKVYKEKVKPTKIAELRSGKPSMAVIEAAAAGITVDDFRRVKGLKEYAEGQRSKDIKHLVNRIKPTATLDDVGGMSEIKNEMFTDIALAMDFENTKKEGATPIKGVLLHGPPGTGKTWLTTAIAGELNATVYTVNGAEILKPLQGQSEQIVKDLFAEARKNAPAIIIFDEMDALTANRDNVAGSGSIHSVIDTFLAEMGGSKPNNGVVVVGTTNRLDLIDPAFKRSGRFDRIIQVNLPKNDDERLEVINVHLGRSRHLLDPSVTDRDVLGLFGKRTFSPAKIERIISDGVQLRLKELKSAREISSIPIEDTKHMDRMFKMYRGHIARLYGNLGIDARPVQSALTPEIRARLGTVTGENYRLELSHFNAALEMIKDEALDEMRGFTTSLRGERPKPEVGKVYGLAVLSDAGSGGAGAEGMVMGIECVCNPNSKTPGSKVIGSEIAESIKASAEDGRTFLNAQSDWAMNSHEFYISFVTAMKGMDKTGVSGPSAGAAITIAEYSEATKLAILPNVVVTGGITPKGELVKVGGLDHKGMGKLVAAANTEGVDTIVIPKSNYEGLSEEDRKSFEQQGLKIVPASNFWEVARAMVATEDGNPLEEQELRAALRCVSRLKEYARTGESGQQA